MPTNDLIIRSDLEIGGDEVLRFARAVTGNSENVPDILWSQ